MHTPSTTSSVGSRYPRPPSVPSSRKYPCILATNLSSRSSNPIIRPLTSSPGGSVSSCIPELISTTQYLYSRSDASCAKSVLLKRLRISTTEILTMDSHFEDLLRGHLGRLFKNERMSIADFQQWFMTAWWEAEDGAPESLYSFGSSIEHLLYIWSSEEWNDAAFLLQLQRAARNYYGSEFAEQATGSLTLGTTGPKQLAATTRRGHRASK